MTAVAPSAPAARPLANPSLADIEASGGLPIVYLVGAGACWLFAALLLLLLDSLKLHMPGLLSGDSFWTYGRVRDASVTCLLYGCAAQWAMAGSLWLLCHVGRARVVAPDIIAIGAFIWNFTLTIGVIAILCGGGGSEALPLPGYTAPVLLAGYLMMAVCAALTFHHRREGLLYPSQWFVVGSLFWFPWIFSTAALLLLEWPVRGALQAGIGWWYGHSFTTVFLGFAGLAPIFYFIPKFSGRPLNSYYMASMAFWILALFGSWGGIPAGAPLPSWIASLGVAGTVFSSIAVLAVAINFYSTLRGGPCAGRDEMAGRFISAGLLLWLLASVQEIAGVLPSVSPVTDFTWYREAQQQLFVYGFFAMTLFGAIYYFVPRVLRLPVAAVANASKGKAKGTPSAELAEAWKPGLMRAHFWLFLAGVVIAWLSLLVAGVWQGLLLQDSANTFVSTMRDTLPAVRGSTLGILLMLIGAAAFCLNFALFLSRQCCARCGELAALWRGKEGR